MKQDSVQEAFAICSDILYDAANRGDIPEAAFQMIDAALWGAWNKLPKESKTVWWNKPVYKGDTWDEPYADKEEDKYQKAWDLFHQMCQDCWYKKAVSQPVLNDPEPEVKKKRRKKKKALPKKVVNNGMTKILPRRIHWR